VVSGDTLTVITTLKGGGDMLPPSHTKLRL